MSRPLRSPAPLRFCSLLLTALLSTALLHASDHAGDRHPNRTTIYPDSLFYHHGGRIIDVTQPPFNARGDGVTDDTAALIRVYDFIADLTRSANDRVHRVANEGGPLRTPLAESYIIYFPAGEYLVSDTLIYSGDPILWRSFPHQKLAALNKVRFLGENRDRTIIRLRDHAPGFEEGARKPVLSLCKIDFNNIETTNVVSRLTIDTGHGNPGAIGLSHAGANLTNLRDLTIRSGDGQGVAGIAILTSPTMGYHTDLTIEGFRTGIWMQPYHMTHNAFEYVTLRGQSEAAITLDDATTSLRRIKVEQAGGPAVLLRGPGSQATILDSAFAAADSAPPAAAISARTGSVLVRDTHTSGYRHAVATPDQSLADSFIQEVTFPAPLHFGSADPSAPAPRLPVADEPTIPAPQHPDDWANVDDFIAAAQLDPEGDVSAAVQAALDSGKAHILFGRQQHYLIARPVTVPAHVRRIDGAFTEIRGESSTVFRIAESAPHPVVIENLEFFQTAPLVRHEQPRTVWISNARGLSVPYRNDCPATTRPQLFLTNVCGYGKSTAAGRHQDIWARWINTEYPHATDFDFLDAHAWIFGYKTEKHRTSFAARGGSHVEVMGGVSNQFAQGMAQMKTFSDDPTFLAEDSTMTVFACTNGPSRDDTFGFRVLFSMRSDDQSVDYTRFSAPPRPGRLGQFFIPFTTAQPPRSSP